TGIDREKLNDVDKALGVWKLAWNLAAPYSLTNDESIKNVIFEDSILSIGCGGGSFDPKPYDFYDPDSRIEMGVLEMLGKA
ncbi:MAG: hypothetical protein WKF37_17180, partial [Bryobacteraceae bacterium]